MEAAALPEQRRPRHRRGKQHSAVERRLIKCKTEKIEVRVTLAIETDYTDSEGGFKGVVSFVDSDSVEFVIDGRNVWIFKAFIVSAEPLHG